MKEEYTFEYENEEEFKKLERSLKKYYMLAFKKLYFEYYPALKEGKFLGEKVNENTEKGKETFELRLPTNVMFSKIYGDIKLHYVVNKKEKLVMLVTLTPEDILTEEHQTELTTYKSVMTMILKQNQEKDMFKERLLGMLKDPIECRGDTSSDKKSKNSGNVKQFDRKYDALIKLKKLLDDDILTKEEYNIEKEKILNEKYAEL